MTQSRYQLASKGSLDLPATPENHRPMASSAEGSISNHQQDSLGRSRQVFLWTGAVVALITLSSWLSHIQQTQQHEMTMPVKGCHVIPDFNLIERNGRRISRTNLENRFVIMNLVFTGCDSACLKVNLRMAELQSMISGVEDAVLVSLTVDPRSDTPEVLNRFATRFRADPNRWLFLTGEKTAIYPLIDQIGLHQSAISIPASHPSDFKDLRKVALFDKQGALRFHFDGLDRGMPAEVVQSMVRLRTNVQR